MWFWHAMVCSFRLLNGRWFIFRDRPDWFVEAVAHIEKEIVPATPDETDAQARSFVDQARMEVMARARQRGLIP
jgi:hypothetical protein